MKFLIQIPQLIFGGAEKVLVSFANELAAHGHDVTILETYEKGYLKPQFDSRVRFDAICSKAYTEKYYASLRDIGSEKNWGRKLQKCGKQIQGTIGTDGRQYSAVDVYKKCRGMCPDCYKAVRESAKAQQAAKQTEAAT